jgi:prolipoprotein diacylglyceryltransferase
MAHQSEVDDLIRDALKAEDVADLERLGEPGMPDMAIGVFRGRLRWYGALFLVIVLVFAVLAAYCGAQFVGATDTLRAVRWGAWFFVCLVVVLSGKVWYWMQMERYAMTREMKRVELLVAHLAAELRARASDV